MFLNASVLSPIGLHACMGRLIIPALEQFLIRNRVMRLSGNKQHHEPFPSHIPPFVTLFVFSPLSSMSESITTEFGVHGFADLKIGDYRTGEKGCIREWSESFCS